MLANLKKNELGYTMIELLLAVVIGSIVLAGAYSSFSVISTQYYKNSTAAEIRDLAVPTIKIMTRDIRMAGYSALDSNGDSYFGEITQPIVIEDEVDDCAYAEKCDRITVIYDKTTTERLKFIYFVAPREGRYALYLDIHSYIDPSIPVSSGGPEPIIDEEGAITSGPPASGWQVNSTGNIVADYIEDFQIVATETNGSGIPTLLDVSLILKSKNKLQYSIPFTTSSKYPEAAYSINDNYMHEEFSFTVYLRNVGN